MRWRKRWVMARRMFKVEARLDQISSDLVRWTIGQRSAATKFIFEML